MMGVWITYKGRETKFWYACTKQQVREVVRCHFDTWRQDINGPILVTDATVIYVTKWGKKDGDDVIEASDPVDVAAMLR
jgi:hypothetical protein